MGCIAQVKQIVKLPKNMMRVLVEGQQRAQLWALKEEEGYLLAEIEEVRPEGEDLAENAREAMLQGMRELFGSYCRENPKVSRELSSQFMELQDVELLVDQISINLPLDYEKRQKLLEAAGLTERYETLGVILANEIEVMQIRGGYSAEGAGTRGQRPERVSFKRAAEADPRGTGRRYIDAGCRPFCGGGREAGGFR